MVINIRLFVWLERIRISRVKIWTINMWFANVTASEFVIGFFLLRRADLNLFIILECNFKNVWVTFLFLLFLLFLLKFLVIFLRSLILTTALRFISVSSHGLLLLLLSGFGIEVLVGSEGSVCCTFARVSCVIREVGYVAI